MTDDYLTREEAAVYTGLALITIDRYLRDGKIPQVRTELQPWKPWIPKAALDLLLRKRARTHAHTKGATDERGHRQSEEPGAAEGIRG